MPDSLTLPEAQALAERFARVDAAIEVAGLARAEALGAVNARCDREIAPMITERDGLREQLAAWWAAAGKDLLKGKAKSAQLGGCTIGTRAIRATLSFEGDEAVLVKALVKYDWAKDVLRTRVSLDRSAALKALDGPIGKRLARMGLGKAGGGEEFVLKRAGQQDTLA